MVARSSSLSRPSSIAISAILAIVISLILDAATAETLRVWKIGSPHTGDTPRASTPYELSWEMARRKAKMSVEAFPARGFAARFRDAVARNNPPDVLVFDNHGVMDGITTDLGHFEGIGEEPIVRRQFIRVTGAFDDLLGPKGGWAYLFTSSPGYEAARRLALRTPECAYLESRAQPELLEILPKVTAAYLGGDDPSLYSDTDRIPAKSGSTWGALTTGVIRSCGVWGNDRLAFASMRASYESPTRIGHIPVLLALRRSSGQWRVLSAARDPITNTEFIRDIASIASLLTGGRGLGASPEPATLLSPLTGQLPEPADGQRFGPFRWRSSQSTEVVADIAEFAYHDDARLFFRFGGFPEAPNLVSEGHLWTTFSEWSWRIWSVTSDGNITFSEARTFTH